MYYVHISLGINHSKFFVTLSSTQIHLKQIIYCYVNYIDKKISSSKLHKIYLNI